MHDARRSPPPPEPGGGDGGDGLTWWPACALADVPADRGWPVRIGGQYLAVFRTRSGLRAVENICGHNGSPLDDGYVEGQCLTCPWHGWRYDLDTGEHLTIFGRRRGIRSFPVRVEDATVLVGRPAGLTGTGGGGGGGRGRQGDGVWGCGRAKLPGRMRLLRRILRIIFSSIYLAIVTFVGAPVAFGATIFAGLVFLPLPATLPVPTAQALAQPSVVYDRDGNVIATYQQFDENLPVTEAQIPPVLKEAVVSDEDRNFYHHGGVDLRGTVRALVEDIRNERTVQGGSTITQQYVKLAYVGSQRTLLRKVREAILASQLDRQASKDQILYHYLTLVYFGGGNYGVGAAAEDYFHVPVQDLDASQAATLAGVIPAPSDRAPTTDLPAAEDFRELVLGKMHDQGYLTDTQYAAAMAEKLVAAPADGSPPPAGRTVVFPPPAPVSRDPAFVNYVTAWLEAHGYTSQELASGGLRIQTTLDQGIEDDATQAVGATLAGTPGAIDMSLAAVEPQTGFVEAIVGGRYFGQQGAKLPNGAIAPYNIDQAVSACDTKTFLTQTYGPAVVATANPTATCWDGNPVDNGGGLGHPPGSSWKPYVLATAFEKGIPPSAVYPAPGVLQLPGCTPAPHHPASDCQVHNDEGGGGGAMTLQSAMVASVNTVYAQLAAQVGCPAVASTAKVMGVSSAYFSPVDFTWCQRYALGEVDVSPLDQASAYGVFADHGARAAPTPILEIVNSSGKVLLDNITHAPATTQVIPANVADNITNVLQGVLGPGGTAYGHGLGRPAAGKTGTTSNETNAWFTGYTPTLSASVWMGRDDNPNVTIGPIKGVYTVFGGTWPAATWEAFMKLALAKVPATPFSQPAPIVPPQVAAALRRTTSTTRPKARPGYADYPLQTPQGGPYVYQPTEPTVVAPTTTSTTTTTLPGSSTTSTSLPGDTTTIPGVTTTQP